MAHTVFIPRRTFFYAIGNTSADLLTETLPREENLDALIIGCGDPRSILYTAYADSAAGEHHALRARDTETLTGLHPRDARV